MPSEVTMPQVGLTMDEGIIVESLVVIAAETARLVAAARSGSTPPDDLSGSTLTHTDLGMFGVEGFTSVINLPECCILGVGSIVREPVVVDQPDSVAVRPTMTLSLVFDHHVIDGAPMACFPDRSARLVENPAMLPIAG